MRKKITESCLLLVAAPAPSGAALSNGPVSYLDWRYYSLADHGLFGIYLITTRKILIRCFNIIIVLQELILVLFKRIQDITCTRNYLV